MAANLPSMTGYGEAISIIDDREWRCVIQSVNSRNLDIRFRLPSSLNALEIPFRKLVQKVMLRGKVDVVFSFSTLSCTDNDTLNATGSFNSLWVADFCRAGESLLEALSWQSSDKLQASILQSAFLQRDAFAETQVKIDCVSESLGQLLQAALSKHFDSRRQEGEHLALDIIARLSIMEDYMTSISEKALLMPEVFRERINIRLDAIIADKQFLLDPARLTQEVAHLIDKADISEEIVRFSAHIIQFLSEINDRSPDRKGKKLEFIVQEMLREINTIGSKANLLEITRSVVEVKNELEKIREQIQNVV